MVEGKPVTGTYGGAIRWNLAGSVLRVCITLGCQLVLLRILGPTIAGQFAIFLIIVGIGTVLSEGGMMATLSRAPSLDTATLRAALFLVTCYATGVCLVLLACAPFLIAMFNLSPDQHYLPYAAIANVLPLGLSSVPMTVLRRQYRAKEAQFIGIVSYALGFAVFAIPAALLAPSVSVMVIAFSIQTGVTVVAAWGLTKVPLVPSPAGTRSLQSTSWRALLGNSIFYLNENAANVLTANAIGTRSLGLYNTAFNLLRMPTDTIMSALHSPLVISAADNEIKGQTTKRFFAMLDCLAGTIFAVYIAVFFTGSLLIVPLLGEKWLEAGPVLSIVGLAMGARLISGLSGAVLWGTGRTISDAIAQAAALTVMLCGFFLIQPQDAEDIASIVLMSYSTRATIQICFVCREINAHISDVWRNLLMPIALTVLSMAPLIYIAPIFLPGHDFFGLIAVAICAGILLMIRVVVSWIFLKSDWSYSLLSYLLKKDRRLRL
jgi:O-antigen/teichoic acid export membrane protein